MKKLLILGMLYSLGSMAIYAQSASEEDKTFIGINAGHMIMVPLSSKLMDSHGLYLPIHVNGYRSLNKNFALSGLLLYRAEKDDVSQTQEFGFAVGPCYTSNYLNGFYADCKVGFGYDVGDKFGDFYTRADFVIVPEAGYFINFASRFTMTIGIGMQSLIRIKENPRREDAGWYRTTSGKMYDHFLPVLNITLGIKL
jgi:hypothetical protein